MASLSNKSFTAYIARHWHGGQLLSHAFIFNFVGIGLICYGLSKLIQHLLSPYPETLFYLNCLLFIVYWFIVFPWQAMGTIRATEQTPGNLRNSLWLMPIQGGVLLTSLIFFTGATSLIQSGFAVYHQEDPRFMEIFFGDPDYTLAMQDDGQTLAINGLFDNGLTKDLAETLAKNPAVATIALDSKGGSIYEARGVAQLIMERQLDTLVNNECSSSCTTAFLAGKKRMLGENGTLGFHQYRFDANYVLPNQKKSVTTEQQRDLAFYQSRGIQPAFLNQIFTTPPENMWFPTRAELLKAGVFTHSATSLYETSD